jgi:hypothetical protein
MNLPALVQGVSRFIPGLAVPPLLPILTTLFGNKQASAALSDDEDDDGLFPPLPTPNA